jgi:hypothetical protein
MALRTQGLSFEIPGAVNAPETGQFARIYNLYQRRSGSPASSPRRLRR